MTDLRWQRMWDVFNRAVETPAPEREAFLESACAGDAALLAKVRKLLTYDQRSTGWLASPPPVKVAAIADAEAPKSVERIGPYRILRPLEEGGMGLVYEAEQLHPVRRRVALKLIRHGLDSREVIARFEAERQALALMDHPHIATVFDGGATEDGRPFFVMELVDGDPITTFCDRQRLDTVQRLKLFMMVCDAVQHAHQKGIIHRDLKPSNILVKRQDGQPVPKIIDFGVARALSRPLTDTALRTELGRMIGTLEYMSPEQARGAPDIDTRSDIYALGVILYQLLTGTLPFSSEALRQAGHLELRRIITEEEPPAPSARLSGIGSASVETAQRRNTDPGTLRRQLRGDLDWIVRKALDKDRVARYPTAAELAADIGRHLEHVPVVAGPPGTAYRVRKFLRRNRLGTALAATSLAFLIVFAVGMAVQSRRIVRALDAAESEQERAEQVRALLVDVFRVSEPDVAKGKELTAREILSQGAERVASRLNDRPVLQAALLRTIAEVSMNLGDYDAAVAALDKAETALRSTPNQPHPDLLPILSYRARMDIETARFDTALARLEEAMEVLRQGPENARSEATLLSFFAYVHHTKGEYGPAERFYREALELWRRLGDENAVVTLNGLGSLLHAAGDYAAAETALHETTTRGIELFGEESTLVAGALNNLGLTQRKLGRRDEAERTFRRALPIYRKLLGDAHPDVASVTNNLGLVLQEGGRHVEAEEAFRETIDVLARALGEEHPRVALARSNLAQLLHERGDPAAAAEHHREAVGAARRSLPVPHPDLALMLTRYARLQLEQGAIDEAQSMAQEAVAMRRSIFPEGHWRIADSQSVAGGCLAARGEFERAEPLVLDSYATVEAQRGPRAPETRRALLQVVALYEAWGRPELTARYRALLPGATGPGAGQHAD